MDLKRNFEKEKKEYAKKQLEGFVKYYFDKHKDTYPNYNERATCTRELLEDTKNSNNKIHLK